MEPENDVDETTNGQVDDGRSVLAQLRARREQLAADTAPMKVLDIPGYDGKLVARYRYPEQGYKAITVAIERAQSKKDPDGILHGNLDALVACCDGVFGRRDGELVDLATDEIVDDDAEGPRFGSTLATLFGIEVDEAMKAKARFIVRNVFSPRATATGVYDGDVAAMTQAGTVIEWLQDTNAETAEVFAGES